MGRYIIFPKCCGKEPCFARREGKCTILKEAYIPWMCPFRKPKSTYTNGVYYPFKSDYLQGVNYDEERTEHKGVVDKQYNRFGIVFHSVHDTAEHRK